MRFLRNLLISRALKSHSTALVYKGWKNFKTVQILSDQPLETNKELNDLVKMLENEGRNVQLLNYNDIKKPKEGGAAQTYYSTDVSYLGRPKKAVFGIFNPNTDVLIDWTVAEESPNDFLSANSNSGFKIGIGRSLPCFDFTVKLSQESKDQVTNEILKYLKMINHDG